MSESLLKSVKTKQVSSSAAAIPTSKSIRLKDKNASPEDSNRNNNNRILDEYPDKNHQIPQASEKRRSRNYSGSKLDMLLARSSLEVEADASGMRNLNIRIQERLPALSNNNSLYNGKHISSSLGKSLVAPSSPIKKSGNELWTLQQKVRQKMRVESRVEQTLRKEQNTIAQQKQQLEKRMQEIKARNSLRMKEIEELEQRYLNKIRLECQKDQEAYSKIERQLMKLQETQSLLSEKERINQEKKHSDWERIRRLQDNVASVVEQLKIEDKLLMNLQKQRIQGILSSSRGKDSQSRAATDGARGDSSERKKRAQNLNTQSIKNEKGDPKKANKDNKEKDIKEMGRKYLEHAKKPPKIKKEEIFFDINLKKIDYVGEMRDMIQKNAGNLSKAAEDERSTTPSHGYLTKRPGSNSRIGSPVKLMKNSSNLSNALRNSNPSSKTNTETNLNRNSPGGQNQQQKKASIAERDEEMKKMLKDIKDKVHVLANTQHRQEQ